MSEVLAAIATETAPPLPDAAQFVNDVIPVSVSDEEAECRVAEITDPSPFVWLILLNEQPLIDNAAEFDVSSIATSGVVISIFEAGVVADGASVTDAKLKVPRVTEKRGVVMTASRSNLNASELNVTELADAVKQAVDMDNRLTVFVTETVEAALVMVYTLEEPTNSTA